MAGSTEQASQCDQDLRRADRCCSRPSWRSLKPSVVSLDGEIGEFESPVFPAATEMSPGDAAAAAEKLGMLVVKTKTVKDVMKLGLTSEQMGAIRVGKGMILMAMDGVQHTMSLAKDRLENISEGDHESFKNIADVQVGCANALIKGADLMIKAGSSEPPKPEQVPEIESYVQ